MFYRQHFSTWILSLNKQTSYAKQTMARALTTSRLDDCGSILCGCPRNDIGNVQLLQNAAAIALTRVRKWRLYFQKIWFLSIGSL